MDNYLTQAQFIREYNDKNREQFNEEFFTRSNQDIMNCLKKVILSCEKDKYFTLKVLDMKEIYSYEEIIDLLKQHEDKKKKKNSKAENPYDYINIRDSSLMMLQVKYFIRNNGSEIQKIDGEDRVVYHPWEIMEVLLLLPRFVKKYYFKLNGNYYSDIFQIVDGSTYNNNGNGNTKSNKAPCNTFKSLFTPIRMFRMYKDLKDFYSGEIIRHSYYTSIITMVFNTLCNVMYFLLANFGIYNTMLFLDIKCVQINKEPVNLDDWYNFEKDGIYISYPKVCGQDPMVQSFAVTLYDAIGELEKDGLCVGDYLYDTHYWITLLGKRFKNTSIDKGLFILDAIDGIYDIITHDELHLPEEQKADIYHIFRWMMREFGNIRKKNNVDVTCKRYRISEPIVTPYAMKLMQGLSALADSGKKVTLATIKRRLYTTPMFIIKKIINMSNLIAYRDMVNDNDGMVAIKYTYKGVSGLGDNGTKIQKNYRYVDPSHAGILDLDSSTTSDPGMSGTVCPLATTYNGNSFSDYEEPNTWEQEFKPFQDEYFKSIAKENIIHPIIFEREPEIDMQERRKAIVQESLEIDKIICPIVSSTDPSVRFSSATAKAKEIDEDKPKSLFTVRKEEPDF